ncbi:hypothetical protein HN789_07870 [archaeon]|jgi:mitochondrial translocator assembly and maintenance protein 41|nr:hypothetical protein [archaeon]MBT4023023.1 hypothetical protein [archaeon]MBT4272014.1 hypothetical protein [archaeon]MBT4461852.1 hypothetical protein [archaeon]MBT4857919.1 hypothetical protein [archaeon]
MSQELHQRVVEHYDPQFAMAYGSGAFPQEGYTGKKQIDFIFGVENPREWHLQNFENNPNDYPLLGRLALKNQKFFNLVQNSGAGIWYIPFVPFEDQNIKYGVMSIDRLEQDLENWETLYAAGRLHKPVNKLRSNKTINQLIEQNEKAALNVAILMLPEQFTPEQLYMTITGISYIGDSRMAIGENPLKVQSIVKGNMEGFREKYESLFESCGIEIDRSYLRRTRPLQHYLEQLPSSLQDIEFFDFSNLDGKGNLEKAIAC